MKEMGVELHNNEVPGDTVWALLVRGEGSYDEYEYVQWFITAEESSAEYRDTVARRRHKTAQRWKVTLPRRRMEQGDVDLYVEDKLLHGDPDGTVQLLDVSVR